MVVNQFTDKMVHEEEVIIDPRVTDAIALIQASNNSMRRQKAMQNIREDKEIYESLTNGLANPEVFKQLKDTTMMQLIRIVSEDAYSLPDTLPVAVKEISEDIIDMINQVKRKYHIEGKLKERMRDVIEHACFQEGTSFIKVLPESVMDYRAGVSIDKLKYVRVDAAKVFYDPKCISDISDGEWDADMETYGYFEAQQIAKTLYGFTGDVYSGTPLNVFNAQDGTGDPNKLEETGDVTFFTFRHKTKHTEW